jgi:hypothetical protein
VQEQAPEPQPPSKALVHGDGAASSKAAPKWYMSKVPKPAVLDEMVGLCVPELQVGAACSRALSAGMPRVGRTTCVGIANVRFTHCFTH